MSEKYNIMVVEDDLVVARILSKTLKKEGYAARYFETAEEALLFCRHNPVDVALLDYSLPGMSGEELFIQLRQLNPLIPVIFLTAIQSVDKAVKLMKMGAYTYLTKPLDTDTLLDNVKEALADVSIEKENKRVRAQMDHVQSAQSAQSAHAAQTATTGNYVFHSEKMQHIMRMVARVAKVTSNILITGESGTGKDVIAQTIHSCSARKNNTLVSVNLAALPSTLMEAELFGHVKGAFSGAVGERPGKFEEADKGTLFLDEIGELAMDVQVKLLRVIQDRRITRLGSNKPRQVDIRLVTATNKNLEEMVKANTFREDLFYRLNVINIDLPPLRERKDDIPRLVNRFINLFNEREATGINGISKDALGALMKYRFPGNIRELENIIERALVLASGTILTIDDLPIFVLSKEVMDDLLLGENESLSLPERLNAIEKHILEKTLKKHGYHQCNTAKALGITESRVRYKIRSLGIEKQ